MGKLATLIKQKKETFLTPDEKEEMQNILRAAAKRALGEYGISEGKLNLLLEDKNILEAAKAVKVSREKNDKAAEVAALHSIFMLLGKAR